jgi:hypothetical protein
MGLIELLSTGGKMIAATWRHGSRFLGSVALACAVAAGVLRVGAKFGIPNAQPWWNEYGLILMVMSAVVAVFAAFRLWAEKQNTGVFLIADEEQSLWHHAKQQDGSILTQFSLRFEVTNTNGHVLHLSKVRILWPWIGLSRILTARVATLDPLPNNYSSAYSIPARSRRECSASVMAKGTIGGEGRKKPMRVTMGVLDNRGRWYKVVFRGLRDPQFGR